MPALTIAAGLLAGARTVESPNCDARPGALEPELVVVHGISLPPGIFGGPWIEKLFLNALPADEHPYFKAIRHLRETPLGGGFISFVSEIPRNAKNIAKLGLTEIREGSKSGNKRQVVVGVHRLGSLTAALAAPAIAQQVVAAIRESYGDEPDEREQESVRAFLPPWMQASEVNILRMEKGRALVLDASFMDPWATIKKPLLAAIREGPSAAFWQAIEPYAQEGLGLKTLVDLNRNENGYTGREIVDPDAPLDIKAKAYGEYAWTAAQPGIVTSARRGPCWCVPTAM